MTEARRQIRVMIPSIIRESSGALLPDEQGSDFGNQFVETAIHVIPSASHVASISANCSSPVCSS